ncbi:hypothetical protein K402DRAFT_389740 [Aulographum hederae CBS 113979]|uniref:Phosphoserine phosphatase n=1 Tax=Aulographum hederae CBS 113979 TaxID=1176131 RepID=A0A6G1HCU5_9PEZI|nr:hypothetical protein K402DRAFT_389740 [Aulographum hederae CBS 113979]
MSTSELPAMKSSPKFIFFTDFDGTITLQDSNDFMTDNIGYGQEKRKQGNKDTLTGAVTFRESFKGMMESVTRPYKECIQYLVDNIKLDPFFDEFLKYALANNIPVVVLTSGMEPIVEALLEALVGAENASKIQVVGNNVKAKDGRDMMNDEDGWELTFHDDSDFGHDKSLTLRPYAQLPEDKRPTMFYAGDGVSDLSAARETDLLFAKKGHDLVSYCVKEEIPFTLFETWESILGKVKEIVAGETTVKEAAEEGVKQFKAGNA